MNIDGWAESLPANAWTPAEPQPPAAPGNLVATALSTTSIMLSWTDNSMDESGFRIEYSLDGLTWSLRALVDANVITMVDTGLVAGTAYYYRIFSLRGTVASPPSNMAAAAAFLDEFANGETTIIGTITGDRSATVNADLVFETLTEKLSGSKNARTSALEHTWTFNLSPGQTHTFFLKAAHSPTPE